MEIRRIRQDEAETVTDLWDAAGRRAADGGALRERGRRDVAAMLVLAASSHRAACLVAEREGALVGFALAELVDDGLLPCRLGRVEELDAGGDADAERALGAAAVAWLGEQGAVVIRADVPLGEPGEELWRDLGFTLEATRFGLYRD